MSEQNEMISSGKRSHEFRYVSHDVTYADNEDLTLDDETEERVVLATVNRLVQWILSDKDPGEIFSLHSRSDLSEEQNQVLHEWQTTLRNCTDKLHDITLSIAWMVSCYRDTSWEGGLIRSPKPYILNTIARRVNRAVSFYTVQGIAEVKTVESSQTCWVKSTKGIWLTTLVIDGHRPKLSYIELVVADARSLVCPGTTEEVIEIGFFDSNRNHMYVCAIDSSIVHE